MGIMKDAGFKDVIEIDFPRSESHYTLLRSMDESCIIGQFKVHGQTFSLGPNTTTIREALTHVLEHQDRHSHWHEWAGGSI